MTTSEHNTGNTSDQSQASPQQKSHGLLYNLCENIDNAVKGATEKASTRASEAAPKVKKAVERGAYKVSYAAAYGVVFGGLVAKHFLKDNVILEGMRDGIERGRAAADSRAAKETTSGESAHSESHPSEDSSFGSEAFPSPA